MKYMIKTLWDKITAAVVYILLAEIVVAVALAVDCLADYRFYTSSPGEYAFEEAMRVKTDEELSHIERYLTVSFNERNEGDEQALSVLERHFDIRATNVVFYVTDDSGRILLTNIPDGETFDFETGSCYKNEKAVSFLSDGEVTNARAVICLRKGLPVRDSYRLANRLISIARVIRYPLACILLPLILASVVVLGLLMSSIGRGRTGDEDEQPKRFIDRIPFDLMVLIFMLIIAIISVLIVLTSVAGIKENNLVLWNAVVLVLTLFISSSLLTFSVTIASRIKSGHVYKNMLIYKAIAGIRKKAGKANDGYFKVPFVSKMLITVGSIIVIEVSVVLYYLFKYRTSQTGLLRDFNFVYFAVAQLVFIALVSSIFVMMAINLYHVRVSGNRLASGDLNYTVDSHILFGDFRQITANLEDIKDDMIRAMEEKNRSREMRNELITNISHDLKTPLTSIISYTDLISSGGCTEEEMKSYLEVLGRQSTRLEDLLKNLIEVSELSAGALKAEFETLDIALCLNQIAEEFLPAFDEKGLEVQLNLPEDGANVICDGSMLLRVLENLFSNVCRYAMPGTRVYIDAVKKDERVAVSIKNTSCDVITLTPEELTERFKRNDNSRSGGGSGLGLSIAKSFTLLQGGTFEITVDGDLFKTELTFRVAVNK
ncbi:MAG: HAMP domain-containing histidine kinase [Clostridiales bacterium]|nr:HAMP domain-containing histidine kinase [Clostridiales bacterium]